VTPLLSLTLIRGIHTLNRPRTCTPLPDRPLPSASLGSVTLTTHLELRICPMRRPLVRLRWRPVPQVHKCRHD